RIGKLPPALDADFNNDTLVNADDLGIWKGAFGTSALGDADGDLDSDGADFVAWQQQLKLAGGATAAPEPATMVWVGCVLLGAPRVRPSLVQAKATVQAKSTRN